MLVSIKPLSVNEAWKGKRYKTDAYNAYQNAALWLLPKMEIPTGDLSISFTFGFSTKAADIDNPVKPFLDILQKKYGFNDSRVMEMNVKKVVVPKGKEFIEFTIKES